MDSSVHIKKKENIRVRLILIQNRRLLSYNRYIDCLSPHLINLHPLISLPQHFLKLSIYSIHDAFYKIRLLLNSILSIKIIRYY